MSWVRVNAYLPNVVKCKNGRGDSWLQEIKETRMLYQQPE